MALIQWPSEARITEIVLTPAKPGQINHVIPSTGAVRTFNRSSGRWTGTITLGRLENMVQGQVIEAFISTLNGSQNTTRIPLTRIKQFKSEGTAPIEFRNALVGRYYTHNNRLIVVYSDGNIFPDLPIEPDTMIAPATSLLIRQSADTTPLMRHRPNAYGPWSFQFQEAG